MKEQQKAVHEYEPKPIYILYNHEYREDNTQPDRITPLLMTTDPEEVKEKTPHYIALGHRDIEISICLPRELQKLKQRQRVEQEQQEADSTCGRCNQPQEWYMVKTGCLCCGVEICEECHSKDLTLCRLCASEEVDQS